jgi:hypothetical protein
MVAGYGRHLRMRYQFLQIGNIAIGFVLGTVYQ